MGKAKISFKEKISRINSDIEQVERTIAENQQKLSSLKETKINTENAEIISIIRQNNLSVEDVAELLTDLKSDKETASSDKSGGNENVGVNTVMKGIIQK